jgi:putative membrane protein
MRKTLMLTAAAMAALSLAACNRQDADEAAPGQTGPVNAVQDATAAAVGATSAATLGANTLEGYVANAARGDMYEMEAAKIALEKSKTAAIKDLARMIQTDHTTASSEMKPLASAAGQTPPTEQDERRKGLLDNLRAASAAEFDKVWLDQQEAAHNEALTLHRGYADNGENAGLKAHAAKVTPKVQAHLDRVKALKGEGAAAPAAK